MRNSILLRIYSILEHMYVNSKTLSESCKWIKDLKEAYELIDNHDISDSVKDIVASCESAILVTNLKERNYILETQFNKVKKIMKSSIVKILENLQEKLEKGNIEDFYIIKSNGYELILAGSFDSSYYHEVEITFLDVQFIVCPGQNFSINRFRLATDSEIKELAKYTSGYDTQGFTICLEHTEWNEKYYIVVNEIEVNWEYVYYYNRENLKSGERIAEWVKKDKN